jgi:Sel1 repeat
MASPWTDPARGDLPSLLRPATADEVALCEAILRDNQRREIVKRTLEKRGFDTKSIAVIAGITDPSKHQSSLEAWEESREEFGELGLLEGSAFEQEADLKAIFETKRSNTAPDEILERLKSIRVIRPRQSLSWYRKAAGSGNAQAQFVLGMMYEKVQQVPQNYAEAAKWYRMSAENGYAAAQNQLGWTYTNGLGLAQDHVEAAKWYRKAAELRNPVEGDHDSGAKAITIPAASRSPIPEPSRSVIPG